MNILGIACHTHDAAAALLVDGQLVAAAEEERFSRIKHAHDLPLAAIHYVLSAANMDIRDIDHVGFHFRPWIAYPAMFRHFWRYFPKTLNVFRDHARAVRSGDHMAYGHLTSPQRVLGVPHTLRCSFPDRQPRFRFHFLEHHLCHHGSAYLVSPFDEAASLSIDGAGEWTTAMSASGRGNTLKVLQRVPAPHSLGMLYNSVCQHLGFSLLDGPGKVMGLAAYGDPARFLDAFRKLVRLVPDGTFRLDFRYFNFHVNRTARRCSGAFERTFGAFRPPGSEIGQVHMDLAAALQAVLEDTVLHMLEWLRQRTGSRHLCLSGGVALNSVMNGRILRSGVFESLFVQPAAGDAGCALGAALLVNARTGGPARPFRFASPYLGPQHSNREIAAALAEAGVPSRSVRDPAETAAALLAQGRIVGWYQGRAELGPRALGNRSILAAPFPADVKDKLNLRVKHREPFRPFAPAVPENRLSDFFDADAPSPYMLLVHPVRRDKRGVLPAVTHVDGTARVQTVAPAANPLFHRLLLAFERRCGLPVVLNTSFNVQGEPIVNTPRQALACFLETGMDDLVIGNRHAGKPG